MYLTRELWYLLGPKIIRDFKREQTEPCSYDVKLAPNILLQRFQGIDYDDQPATLILDSTGRSILHTLLDNQEYKVPALFHPQDAILGVTEEYFTIPRYITTEFRLKSTVARAGCNHRLAVWAENGFHGNLVLELDFTKKCMLVPGKMIGQMIASLTLPTLKPYQGKYQGQEGVIPALRVGNCAVQPVR